MNISIRNNKLRKLLLNEKKLVIEYGQNKSI